ncbi:HIRAN domain-containing protein [Leifsonia shinshuensis]
MKRYPLGMRAWVFWVIVLVIGGLIGNIPFVGTVIMSVLLAAALWWFFARVPREPDRRYLPYAPVPISGSTWIDLAAEQEVVGESFYHAAIAEAVLLRGRIVTVKLRWEPRNPHDRNAVRVEIDRANGRLKCGYLPATVAPAFVPQVRRAADAGLELVSWAQIYGGELDKPNYGVWLTGSRKPAARRA